MNTKQTIKTLFPIPQMLFSSLVLWIGVIFSGHSQQSEQAILLSNVQVVKVESGEILPNSAILIEKGLIRAIGPKAELAKLSQNKLEVDGQGKYLIPGLWDMHVHLEGADLVEDNEALLPVFLAYGITTVRDCASDLGLQVLKWREEINQGTRLGPTIYTAGRKLEGKNSLWKGDLEISNEEELHAMLDTLERDRVDFVKITENTLNGELFLKSVQAAHDRGFRVSGHVPMNLTISELLDAGYTSVEHASYLLRLGGEEDRIMKELRAGKISNQEADQQLNATFDQTRAIEKYRNLGSRGLFVCPTLIGSQQLAYLQETDHSQDEFLDYLSERFVRNYQWRIDRMANETPAQLQQRKDRLELLKQQLPLMQEAGIRLMAGSDAAALNTYVYPAESLLQELEIFQEAGLSPLQILQSTTLAGAEYFGVTDQQGSISPGKKADLVLLEENPLERIQALRAVNSVLVRGRFYDRSQLDLMLENARQTKLKLDRERSH
ncbi:MAG: amidohydrolase family protein [Cyclobacteriaceae bacterium]|nr:amidohydrolase family protein [Cyclobacteriaceae bacterium]MDX5466439.1 amidohydrolase family protein [Cyclobacteriaceae bacterium]